MKTLVYSLTALSLLDCSTLAEDKKPIEAKLITTSISHGLPEGFPVADAPYTYKDGVVLKFFFQAENIVSFDKESFFVEGWDKDFTSRISRNGNSATISIFNKKFKGIIEEIEADGRVDAQLGFEPVTKKIKLKVANEVEFPLFKMELNIDEGNDRFNRSGIIINGKHKMIKSICILRDGKEITSNGSSSSNDRKTYMFRDIKDGDEIKFTYWSKLVTRSVKLYK